jgi:hypothetical protein
MKAVVPNAPPPDAPLVSRKPLTNFEVAGYRFSATKGGSVIVRRAKDDFLLMKTELPANEVARDLLFKPNASLLFVLSDQRLYCYDVIKGKQVWSNVASNGRQIELVRNGTEIAVSNMDGKTSRYDAQNGKRLDK